MPTVRSGDAEIFWDETGEGDPLLLVMGLGADARGWIMQRPAFEKHYRATAFDNRGVGPDRQRRRDRGRSRTWRPTRSRCSTRPAWIARTSSAHRSAARSRNTSS